MKKFGMLIDIHYCTGCHTCEVACQQENNFSVEQHGIKVTEHVMDQKKGLMIDYVPYVTDMCNFCLGRIAEGKKPSCVKHCLSQCMSVGPIHEIVEEAKNAKKPMLYFK